MIVDDKTQYDGIILGDSTMAMSSVLPYFKKNTTQSIAIPGNRLCDDTYQLNFINTTNPQFIIVGSTGGDDILSGVSNTVIINTGTEMISMIRAKFLYAKIILVGIHPTLYDYSNQNKSIINSSLKTALSKYGPQNCFVDPGVVLGIAEGQPMPAPLMFDTVHYNAAVSFAIKSAILEQCLTDF